MYSPKERLLMKQKNCNNNIFMDEPSGELTFGKIFKVLKCSLLRMLVYLLIACIIASSVALVITITNPKESSISTIIEYNNKGIDKGKDPFGATLSVDRIKNADILSKAIKRSELDNIEGLNPTNLANNIKITGIIPQDAYVKIEDIKANSKPDANINELLNSIVYYPKRYVLKFENYDRYNLSEAAATTLLNNIITEYQIEWNKQYNPLPTVPTTIFEEILKDNYQYEYIEYAPLLKKHVNQLADFINLYKSVGFVANEQQELSDGTKVSNSISFGSLITELDILNAAIQSYDSYVVINKVYKDATLLEAAAKNDVETYTKLAAKLEADKVDIITQLNDIKPSQDQINKPNGDIQYIERYPETYTILQNALLAKNREISECRANLNEAQKKLDNINSNKPYGDIAVANKMLKGISNDFISIVNKASIFVESYKENSLVTDDVTMATPISRSNQHKTSNKVILVLFLVGAVVAVIASISVTVAKQKAFAFAKKSAKKTEDNVIPNADTTAELSNDVADEICANTEDDNE